MTITSTAPTEGMNAVTYKRAHAGKLMVLLRKEGRALAQSDFFHLDSVGTHPTGLMVTGLFANERRSHMMASAVREANEEEIAWRNQFKEEQVA